MKVTTLKEAEFDQYASNHKYRSYYQTSTYGNTMAKFGYDVHYIGFQDDYNKLIGATLIIYKSIFMNNKVAYAPRGILFDYEDADDVGELALTLKQSLGKQGFMLLRMDPLIPATIRNNEGDIMNVNNEANIIMSNLKAAGFLHKGNNLFFETEKSRWEALTVLNTSNDQLFKKLEKGTRHKIQKASKSGVEIYKDPKQNVEKLYDFIKKKHNRSIEYYQELITNFKDNIDVYYAVLNTEEFVINSKNNYEEEMNRNEELASRIQVNSGGEGDVTKALNLKMDSDKLLDVYKKQLLFSTNQLKEHPEGIVIGGAICITFDNAAFLVIEGFDQEYSTLNCNFLLKWQMMCDYNEKGCKYFNLNAVSGDFENEHKYSGLNEMKLGYNSVVTEYIGEFDIVLNNLSYNLYKGISKK